VLFHNPNFTPIISSAYATLLIPKVLLRCGLEAFFSWWGEAKSPGLFCAMSLGSIGITGLF